MGRDPVGATAWTRRSGLAAILVLGLLSTRSANAHPRLGERTDRAERGNALPAERVGPGNFSLGRAQPEALPMQPLVDLINRSGGRVAFDGSFELPVDNSGAFSLRLWETAVAVSTFAHQLLDIARGDGSRRFSPAVDILPNVRPQVLAFSDARAASPIVARWVSPPFVRELVLRSPVEQRAMLAARK